MKNINENEILEARELIASPRTKANGSPPRTRNNLIDISGFEVSIVKSCSSKIPKDTLFQDVIKDIIFNNTYENKISTLRKLVKTNAKAADDFKKFSIPAFTPAGLFKDGRTKQHLVKYLPLLVIDIDHLDQEEILEDVFTAIINIPYTCCAFRSPRGSGVKAFVITDSYTASNHENAYKQVAAYYKSMLNVEIDESGKDYSRLCIVSHDPKGFLNENTVCFKVKTEPTSEKNVEPTKKVVMSDAAFEKKYAMALKWTYMKQPKFEAGKNRNIFIHYLACNCNRFGLDQKAVQKRILDDYLSKYDFNEQSIIESVNSAYKNVEEFATADDFSTAIDELTDPIIPNEVYENLPNILMKACEPFDEGRQRDIFLTGALGVLSGCFPSVFGLYGNEEVYSNLFIFISAPPASGKGVLIHTRTLALRYHEWIRSQTEGDVESVLFVPGNISSAAIMAHLEMTDGSGIFFETEADTMSNSLNQEWGNFSDILRRAFQHELVSSSRAGTKKYLEIELPKLSVVLTGTPMQIPALVDSTENGLFSRFLFYSFDSPPVWKSVAPNRKIGSFRSYFNDLSEEVFKLIMAINGHGRFEFMLKDHHWQYLEKSNKKLLETLYNKHGNYATGIAMRTGLIWYKIAMILTILRNGWDLQSTSIKCSNEDFELATKLTDIYKTHIIAVFESLPKQAGQKANDSKLSQRERKLYKALPAEFDSQELIALGEQLEIPERTVYDYRKKFVNLDMLEVLKAGKFKKVS
jgi:hypothetical protein